VLLPTRNGGKFIRNCIASVLDQPFKDLELVVSDNCNADETPEELQRFAGDPRIRVIRQDRLLSVTENWTAAYQACRGEYLLMMGDDDCVLPGYFDRLSSAIDRHREPECIAYNAYSYIFPDSIDGDPKSYYGDPYFHYGPEFASEGPLPLPLRRSIVRDMYSFRHRFPLNMQIILVSRKAAERIRGGFYQPPFPDHFAINALLLDAERFVFIPEKRVVVGVSPKSFGSYFFNDRQDRGLAYLSSDAGFEGRLPGNEIVNASVVWLQKLKRAYGDKLGGFQINRPEYYLRQLHAWIVQARQGKLRASEVAARAARIPFPIWTSLFLFFLQPRLVLKLGDLLRRKRSKLHQAWSALQPAGGTRDIREFSAWVGSGRP